MSNQAFEWQLSSQQRKTFSEDFQKLIKATGQNAVTGAQAKEFFTNSKLQVTDLAQIWVLSDRDHDKELNEEEFFVAQFLVYARKNGVPVPAAVPDELLASIRQKPSKKISSETQQESPKSKSSKKNKESTSKVEPESRPKRSSSTLRGIESAPNSTGRKAKSKWSLSREEKKRFIETFASRNTDGFVDGPLAVALFTTSGLPREDLAKIWALSDMDRDTKLSQQEFCIAMHLITRRMQGETLPDVVPATLVLSAASDLMKKGPKSGLNKSGQASGLTRTNSAVQARSGERTSPQIEVMEPTISRNAGLTRSASQAPSDMYERANNSSPQLSEFDPRITQRAKITTRVMSMGPGSYSAGDIGGLENSLSATSIRPSLSIATTIASYGIDDKIIPEYDCTSDMLKLDEIYDLPSVRALAQQLSDEVKTITNNLEKAQVQTEALQDKLNARAEQNMMAMRRKQNFESILSNYNAQLEIDMSLYTNVKSELQDLASEIEEQQQLLQSPNLDLQQIRERRRVLQNDYTKIKAEYNASKDEYMRLAVEVERLKAEGAEAAASIDTNWIDHGFKDEPAVSFGDSDFSSNEAPTFQFNSKASAFGMDNLPSGTMTPVIDDFDGEDSVTDEVNLNWLKSPDFVAVQSNVPNSSQDFFQNESKEWADFSATDDAVRRKRTQKERKVKKRKDSKAEPKAEEKEKKKKSK